MTCAWSQLRLSFQLHLVNLRMACQQPLSYRLKVMANWMLLVEIHLQQIIVRQITIALNGLSYLLER